MTIDELLKRNPTPWTLHDGAGFKYALDANHVKVFNYDPHYKWSADAIEAMVEFVNANARAKVESRGEAT